MTFIKRILTTSKDRYGNKLIAQGQAKKLWNTRCGK